MRQRKIKDLDSKIKRLSDHITDKDNKGNWRDLFLSRQQESAVDEGPDSSAGKVKAACRLYAEIGCGKGRFITDLAAAHPGDYYLGIEGHESVILRSLEKAEEAQLNNVLFIPEYIKDIRDIFDDDELDGIYLNFSDPWPKARHEKRRLTHRNFLKAYAKVVKPGGFIQFKTDNDGLFQFTLEEIEACGMEITEMSYDLHSTDFEAKETVTEYEERFITRGTPIKYVKIAIK